MDAANPISDLSENAADGVVLNQPQYVVGIGASAGGLEALEQFFEKMPAKTGLAFVVVQHLSPDFRSLMDELVTRRTAIPLRRVEDGMAVEPDTFYLIPPKKEMIISGGKLLLTDKDPNQALSNPKHSATACQRRGAHRRSQRNELLPPLREHSDYVWSCKFAPEWPIFS